MIKHKLEFDDNFNVTKKQIYKNDTELIEENNYNSFGNEIGYQFIKNDIEFTLNENGELHGLYRSYFSNCNLELECNYKNGLKHGLYRSYFSNGDLCEECNFKNGELHGLYLSYYENSKKHRQYNMINGNII